MDSAQSIHGPDLVLGGWSNCVRRLGDNPAPIDIWGRGNGPALIWQCSGEKGCGLTPIRLYSRAKGCSLALIKPCLGNGCGFALIWILGVWEFGSGKGCQYYLPWLPHRQISQPPVGQRLSPSILEASMKPYHFLLFSKSIGLLNSVCPRILNLN